MTGAITVNNAAITSTGAGGVGVLVNGGTLSLDYNGTIAKVSDGRAIDVQNHTGGTISFDGTVSSTSASDGIFLNANTGATINFTGALTLNTSASNTNAFTATGGGTISSTASGSTINSGQGRAIDVQNTTIGASGLTFQSVSASGGSTTAIFLKSTGTGAFVIAGTGSTGGSGGTIKDIGGADAGSVGAAATEGTGIYLENVSNVSLANMIFGSNAAGENFMENFAIRGESVNNFTLTDSEFRGTFGDTTSRDEDTIRFGSGTGTTGLTGTAVFQGNNIQGGLENNLSVYVYGGNALDLTIRDTVGGDQAVIGGNSTVNGAHGFSMESGGTSNVTLNVTGVQFTGANGTLLNVTSIGSATQNLQITNNTLHNGQATTLSGGVGVNITGNLTNSNITYNIDGNSFRGTQSSSIFAMFNGASGTVNGIVNNNTFGNNNGIVDNAQANYGSLAGGAFLGGIDSKSPGTGVINYAVRISNNTIRDSGSDGVLMFRSATQNNQGTARVEATITNNTIDEARANVVAGLYLQPAGSGNPGDSGKIGINMTGNTIDVGDAAFADAVYVDNGSSLTGHVYFPGYAGPSNPFTELSTFLTSAPRNNVFTAGSMDSGTGGAVVNPGGTLNGQAFALPPPSPFLPEEGSQETAGLFVPQQAGSEQALILVPAEIYLGSARDRIALDEDYVGRELSRGEIVAAVRASGWQPVTFALVAPAIETQATDTVSVPASGVPAPAAVSPTLQNGTQSATIGTLPAGQQVVIQFTATVDSQTNQLIVNPQNTGTVSATNVGTFPDVNTNTVTTTLDTLALGNLIFLDANNNGLFDGGDSGITGVALTLFADTNNDGAFDAGDTQLATTTSGAGGLYSFTGLAPGNYIVRVDADNFTPGGNVSLVGRVTATGGPDPDNGDPDTDNDDNGVNGAGGIVVSQAITLAYNTEPTAGTGNDTNNTLDFGFVDLNDAPVNTVPGAQTINEDATLTFTGGNAISIADADAGSSDLTTTLSIADGALSVGAVMAGLVVTGEGTNLVTLTGTLAEINDALNGLTYTPPAHANGSRTLTVTTNDNGNTGVDPGNTGTATSEEDSDPITINITAPERHAGGRGGGLGQFDRAGGGHDRRGRDDHRRRARRAEQLCRLHAHRRPQRRRAAGGSADLRSERRLHRQRRQSRSGRPRLRHLRRRQRHRARHHLHEQRHARDPGAGQRGRPVAAIYLYRRHPAGLDRDELFVQRRRPGQCRPGRRRLADRRRCDHHQHHRHARERRRRRSISTATTATRRAPAIPPPSPRAARRC